MADVVDRQQSIDKRQSDVKLAAAQPSLPRNVPILRRPGPAPPSTQLGQSYDALRARLVERFTGRSDELPAWRTTNVVITSKFTWLTFLPVNLYNLLHPKKRFANFYFLMVGVMQMIPWITLTGGYPTTWLTLFSLIAVDIIVLMREDLERKRADSVTNASPVEILRGMADGEDGDAEGYVGGELCAATWADVRAGDVVRVRSRQAFPADLLLLRGSDPPGQCWVNTKPLDGESDTKLRLAPRPLVSRLGDDVSASALRRKLRGSVQCEAPNDKVNDFTGQLRLDDADPIVVTEENMLLRGCTLRNTDWVLGLVVACGAHTKINFAAAGEAREKVGHTMSMINADNIGVFLWLAAMCVLGAALATGLLVQWSPGDLWYLRKQDTETSVANFFIFLGTNFVLCYQFVPISLYVSMNMVQLFSRYFVTRDLELYHAEQDEPCQVRSMGLLDELGQVSHIFSDKTGTLTSNLMAFRRLYIGGVQYGIGETAISRALKDAPADDAPPPPRPPPEGGRFGCRPQNQRYVDYEEAAGAPSLFDVLTSAGGAGACAARELIVAMAVNHSVLIESVDGVEELSASSPDEQAFVAAAEHFGYEFAERDMDAGIVRLREKRGGGDDLVHEVQILHVIPYESSRKRMSVIVRLPPALLAAVGGGVAERLYCKGADSALLALLESGASAPKENDAADVSAMETTLYEWGDIALRTLVWGVRELANYGRWASEYEAAIADPSEVLKLKLGEPGKIAKLQAEVEGQLRLQGATAIEDQLQDGVPDCLADLRLAGIKIWMLTGDKVGTAKNIAKACNILPRGADILEITVETHPVLGELQTSALIAMQGQIAMAEAEAAAARKQDAGVCGRFARRVRAALGRNDEVEPDAAVREAVAKLTRELDKDHPALEQVRCALDARRQHAEKVLAERIAARSRRARPTSPPPASRVPSAELRHVDVSVGKSYLTRGDSTLDGAGDLCLVLDEKAIEYLGILCKEVLAAVSDASRSVVACRARKDQKAQMVNMIRSAIRGSCTLGVGDGANDVAMIQAAHVGVGIIGKEGRQARRDGAEMAPRWRRDGAETAPRAGPTSAHISSSQAVNNSDFAIGQFRFLRGLLLVHGRYNYRRLSVFAHYMFYKNIGNTLTMWLYMMLALASGTRLFYQFYFDWYNVFYTALPIIVFAFDDMDVPKDQAAHHPQLYKAGIDRIYYTHAGFMRWIIEAIWLAVIAAYLPLIVFPTSEADFYTLSITAMCIVVAGANLRLALETHSWGPFQHAALWVHLVFLEITCLLMGYVISYGALQSLLEDSFVDWLPYNETIQRLYTSGTFWFVILLSCALVLLPRGVIKAWGVLNAPSAVKQVLRLINKRGVARVDYDQRKISTLAAAHMAETSVRARAEFDRQQTANLPLISTTRQATGFAFDCHAASDAHIHGRRSLASTISSHAGSLLATPRNLLQSVSGSSKDARSSQESGSTSGRSTAGRTESPRESSFLMSDSV